MDKHDAIVLLKDYSFKDLQDVIKDVTSMKELYWTADIQTALTLIAKDFNAQYNDLKEEQRQQFCADYLGWALFIGVCLAEGKKTELTRVEGPTQ